MKKPDIIAGCLGIFLSAYVYIQSGKFPEDKVLLLGPSYFPRLLAMALFALSGFLVINALLGRSAKSEDKFDIKDPGIQRSGIALLSTMVYCFLMKYMGFIICSIIYLVFLMYLLKKRNYVSMVGISTLVTLVIYMVFKMVLNITLPLGFWS